MDYVIEIIIPPWDSTDPRNAHAVGHMKAHPLHEDEMGRTHLRNQASVVPVSCNSSVKSYSSLYGLDLDCNIHGLVLTLCCKFTIFSTEVDLFLYG